MATLEFKDTRFGRVRRLNGGCKDDYNTIQTSRFFDKQSGVIKHRLRKVSVTLQGPALDAFKRAEVRAGREIRVTGSRRTCAQQAAFYKEDPKRYAPPWVGLHCQALAVDVHTEDLVDSVVNALLHVGFTRARADEPWHFSYGWTA